MAAKTSGGGSCVAVDLDATAVRVVEVEWPRSGDGSAPPQVVRMGNAGLPPGLWNDLSGGQEAFASAIRQALSASGITARFVVASIPRRLVTVRFARLPHAPPEQMRNMVAFEAQQYILFSLDEVILDYHVLPELTGFATGGEDLDTVLLAAARRTLIADLTAIFDRAGLELERLSVSALALAEHIRDALEPTAIVDIDPGDLDVAVVADGRLLFTRSAALHGENVLPEGARNRAVEEIARSFAAYQNEFRNQPLAHVYLTGSALPGATPAETEQILSDVLGMPVSYLHSRLLDAPKRDYATAIGVALQTRPDSLAPINLYPNERAVQRAQKARRQRVLLVSALAGCLAIAGVSIAMRQLEARGRAFRATVRANEALSAVTTQLEAREKAHRRLLDLENDLTTGLDRAHPAVDVLVALDQALPRSTAIWLTQMSFERNGLITLRGESRSEAAATDFVLALQKAGPFMDVRLGYLGDAEDTAGKNEGTAKAPPPPTSGQPTSGQAKPPAASARKSAQATLSSFIITCRVNPKAQSLLPPKLVAAKPPAPARSNGKSKSANGRDDSATDLMDETGDEFGDQ